jgi:hypothetical protein
MQTRFIYSTVTLALGAILIGIHFNSPALGMGTYLVGLSWVVINHK